MSDIDYERLDAIERSLKRGARPHLADTQWLLDELRKRLDLYGPLEWDEQNQAWTRVSTSTGSLDEGCTLGRVATAG